MIQESCSGDLVCRVMMMVTVVAMSVTIRQRGRGRCGRSHSGKLVNANRRNRDFLIQIWPFLLARKIVTHEFTGNPEEIEYLYLSIT